MGTGLFTFDKHDCQALLVARVTEPVAMPERIFEHSHHDAGQWIVRDVVEAGFDVKCSGVEPLPFRYKVALPEALVNQCREVLGGLNWVSMIFPSSKQRAVSRVNMLLNGRDVQQATAMALEIAERRRAMFMARLKDALEDSHADLVQLLQGRQNLMHLLT